jgi:2-deoxy-D-gluconate 3-dehydrogenase
MCPSKKYAPLAELIDLSSKRAIVTGGAQGIGYAIAHRLAEAGAQITVADIDSKEVEKAGNELRQAGFKIMSAQCDVSDEEEVKTMTKNAVENMGGIDILVNNAGIYPSIPLSQMTYDEFEKVMVVNVTGTFLCSRESSNVMREQDRGGCIINIASIDSVHPSSKGLTAYDASKGGVLTLTKSMALELGKYDIRVNAIAPGGILTEGLTSNLKGMSASEGKTQLKSFMARMALGRMGNADDVGRVALFLASDLASYITGSLIVVDGGYLIS